MRLSEDRDYHPGPRAFADSHWGIFSGSDALIRSPKAEDRPFLMARFHSLLIPRKIIMDIAAHRFLGAGMDGEGFGAVNFTYSNALLASVGWDSPFSDQVDQFRDAVHSHWPKGHAEPQFDEKKRVQQGRDADRPTEEMCRTC